MTSTQPPIPHEPAPTGLEPVVPPVPTATLGGDHVWGAHRPSVLPPTAGTLPGSPGALGGPHQQTGPTGPRHLSPAVERAFATLRRAWPRDTRTGVVGGVAAGIAARLGVSTAAVRIATVLLATVFGVGIGAYLIAWAVLPDERGRTHVEQAVRDGRGTSLTVLALAALPLLALAGGVVSGSGPILIVAAVVALVARKKGHFHRPAHG